MIGIFNRVECFRVGHSLRSGQFQHGYIIVIVPLFKVEKGKSN